MKRIPREILVWLACLGFFLIIAVSVNYHHVLDYMFSDEMAYYMMAQSLSADNDLIYTQQDLRRVYEDGWSAGPIGIFLNKMPDGTIYISKSFIYSWVLSPFFTLFGFNGFLILNVSFFFLCILMGWLYLRQYTSSSVAMAFAMMFFILSASMIYVVWLTPEIFTMFCITLGLFLWLYEQESPRKGMQGQRVLPLSLFEKLISCLRWLFLTPHGRRYLAPLPLAVAAIAKLPNILFFAPLIADVLFLGGVRASHAHVTTRQKAWRIFLPRIGTILVLCAIFAGMVITFYGVQAHYTGSANPYGGDRRTFVSGFPFSELKDSWEKGIPMTSEGYFTEDFFFHPKTLLYNIYYYVFGRFTGLFPYFTSSLLAAALFFWQFIRRHLARSDEDRRALWRRGFLFVIILASIGAYIVLMPINYHGGGGAFGNRYFINIYPAFLFLILAVPRLWPLVVSGVISAIFLAPSLITPFQSSYFPALQGFRMPFRLFPVELSLIDTLPTDIEPRFMQTELLDNGFAHRLYFFDDHALDATSRDFWVKGGERAELALRTTLGQRHLVLTVTNGVVPNKIDVRIGKFSQIFLFSKPYETRVFAVPLEEFLPYFKNSLYPISVFSHAGAAPKFVPGMHSADFRNVGCHVHLSLDPIEIGSAYLENGQPDEALAVLTAETAMASGANEIRLRYLRGLAYQQTGKHNEALSEFRWCEQHLADFWGSFFMGMVAQSNSKPPVLKYSTEHHGEASAFFRHEAEELSRTIGDIVQDDSLSNGEGIAFVPERDHQGYLAFGQYVELPPGDYQVNFRLKIGDSPDISPEKLEHIALFLDVFSAQYGLLAEEMVRLTPQPVLPFGQYHLYSLRFSLKYALVVEFRARATGYAPIEFDAVDLIPLLPTRLHDALGVSLAQKGEWEEAARYFRTAENPSIRKPAEVQAAFVEVLLHLQEWDDVLDLLSHEKIDETGHTGQWTHVLSLRDEPGEFPNIPPQVQEKLNEMWQAFSPAIPASLTFGERMRFVGYDVSASSFQPGGQMHIRYYWQALAAMKTNYTIFVHITRQGESAASLAVNRLLRRIGIGQARMFQQDHAPFHGGYPTRQWLKGEWLREDYTVTIPPSLAPGQYDIWLGLYNPATGQRLTSESGEKVKIGELTILPN